MPYAVVYQGEIIGYSDLERSSGVTRRINGQFRPTSAFAKHEATLRPYGGGAIQQRPDGEVLWFDRRGSPLPPLRMELRNAEGLAVEAVGVRVTWPGDRQWQRDDELAVVAIMAPSSPDPEPDDGLEEVDFRDEDDD